MKGGDYLEHSIVIKGLLSQVSYTKYHSIINEVENLPKEIKSLVKVLGLYWESYPERPNVSEDDLFVFYQANYPQSKDTEFIKNLLDQAKQIRIENPEILTSALNVLVYQAFLASVTQLGMSGMEKFDPELPDKLVEQVDAYKVLTGSVKDPESRVFKKTMMEIIKSEKSIDMSWRTRILQQAMGNPRPGRLHHVFGHVHSGKSALLISECTNFARQLFKLGKTGESVLYVTNEEGCEQLMPRIYASLLGQPMDAVRAFPERAEKAYQAYGGQYLKVVEDCHHITQVQRNVVEMNPRLMFIDQGTKVNISAGKNTARHEMLQKIYNEYRRLVVKYKMDIVACGQASDESSRRRWLALRDMDGSKVGLPGELDVAIGIGQDDREGMERVRYINIPKNRYNGMLLKETLTLNEEKVRFE